MQDTIENLVTLFENGTLSRRQLIQGLLSALAPLSLTTHALGDTSNTSAFRGRSLNHVTLSVTDVERSQAFYSRLLGGTIFRGPITAENMGAKSSGATLALQDGFISLNQLGAPRVHHFCVGVEDFSIDSAFEKLQREFPESKPTNYRGEELYFRDPDGILGQISQTDYRARGMTP